MRIRVLLLLPALLVLSLTADARRRAVRSPAAEEAVHYRGNAERTGVLGSRGPLAAPRIAWQATLANGASFAPPIYAGGTVYVPDGGGRIVAFDAATGAVRYTTARLGAFLSTPAVAPHELYAGSEARSVRVVDRATGALVRSLGADNWVIGSPLLHDGTIFFGTESGTFLAMDAASGAERWRVTKPHPVHTPAALSEERVHFNDADTLFALDAASGAERWRIERPGHIWLGQIASEGTVYAILDGGEVFAFDARDGAERWRVAPPQGVTGWSFPSLLGGILFASNDARQLVAFEAATGRTLWTFPTRGTPTEPFLAGAVVYIGDTDAHVYAIDAATGNELWSTTLSAAVQTGPAIGAGRLFVVSANGTVSALE